MSGPSGVEVRNPILRGFHPDPSIVRVGPDYYIANSTFEWFPGIRLHHSTDLAQWRPAGYALADPGALDLRGVPDSGGIWAPSLSYHDGRFWLVYAVVCTRVGPFKDLDVLLVTAPSIDGPWTAPLHLGSGGFDPSIFHDEDGRHWLVNMTWDHRPDRPSFAGIVLHEIDPARGLVGARRLIHTHDELIEGPNLYRRDGWYYLMLAEGGTGWNHGISVVRSRDIAGPYEPDPHGPLLTSRDREDLSLQKAGHGELVETGTGEWYLVHLASRPLTVDGERRCMLGRETCLQRLEWTAEGWPRLAHGDHWPRETVVVPASSEPAVSGPSWSRPSRDEFDTDRLSDEWNSLRQPVSERWLSLTERPGWLRLRGRYSLHAHFGQSLIAQRLAHDRTVVTTAVQIRPEYPGQQAGLVCWYDTGTHFFLGVTTGDDGPFVVLAVSDLGVYAEHDTRIRPALGALTHLRATIDRDRLRFAVSHNGTDWTDVGQELDASVLSDDYGNSLRFTGAFVGLAAHDPVTGTLPADFSYFDHRELPA
ncbi:glycoside hydrolase family 43 protein [Saccharothrix sp. ALI-22-I]|uniref:glycoside hydrolase family 43 protein n=1 Tax=Saccharothrix sp. ALI-22-I TaxID=1933778 RepID=UPI0019310489|nr:glycoside hydrolase family 43 protein [Saccharothrix sp. ALI-22-I]